MSSIRLELDFSEVKELQDAISQLGHPTKENFSATSASVHKAAQYVQSVWSDYLAGGELNGIKPLDKPLSPKDAHLRIEDRGDFESAVVGNSPKLDAIQHGENPVYYDMKQTHPYGKKSRVSKKGIPYLIIKFGWGTPNEKGTKRAHFNNVIPQKDYETRLKGFEISSVKTTTHLEPNSKGQPIDRQEYIWKSRLKEDDAWNNRSIGMVRMKDIRGSTYFTFRVISAKSPQGTWLYWKDGKNPVDMLGALVRTTQDNVEKIIESGIKTDIGI